MKLLDITELKSLIGQTYNAAQYILREFFEHHHTAQLRVVLPGQPCTQDFSYNRVNIIIGEMPGRGLDEMITDIYVG